MKRTILLALLLLSPLFSADAQVIFPNRGGLGTTTIPTTGQVLVGQVNGTYAPQATSTLGVGGLSASQLDTEAELEALLTDVTDVYTDNDGTLADDDLSDNSTSDLAEGSRLYYTVARVQAALAAGYNAIFGNSTTTNATTTNLSVTGSFNFLGTLITNVGTWFAGLFDINFAAKDTGDLAEGSSLYFTDARARQAISETVTGISYSSASGVFSLTSGYSIPLSASTTEWATAYGWGDHSAAGYISDLSGFDTDDLAEGSTNLYSQWDAATGGINYSSGNVGIGTASPIAGLDIRNGDIYIFGASDRRLLIGDAASGGQWGGFRWDTTTDTISFGHSGSSGTVQNIVVNSSGNIGIGTTTPNTALHVIGTTTVSSLINCDTIDTDANGVLSCGSDAGAGGGITSLNGLSDSSQTFATSTSGGLTLSIASAAGVHTFAPGLVSGYAVPLAASSTNWNTLYDTPSNRITAGTGIDWSGNTLNVTVVDTNTTYTAGDALTLTGTDFDFDGGATPGGDLGGTWASPTVDDDSHNHTSSTISGLDISADTNLSVSATGLTLSGDTVALGAGYIIPLSASTTEWSTAYGWGDHSAEGYLTTVDISDDTNLSGDTEIVLTGDVLSIASSIARDTELPTALSDLSFDVGSVDTTEFGYLNGVTSAIQTQLNGKQSTLTTGNLTESITGLEFSSTRQVIGGAAALSLTSGYVIPLSASTTEWSTAFGWGDHSTEGYLTGITGQSLEDLSDVASFTQAAGDVLYWTGSAWNVTATSTWDTDTNTNASTICAGTTTYLDGEGNCDNIASVYQAADSDLTTYAGITPSANVQSLLGAADFAAIVAFLESAIEAAIDTLSNLVSVAISTTLQIPFGASCDSNADGEICHDTSGDQLIMDGKVVGSGVQKLFSVTVASTSPAFIDAGLLTIPTNVDGYTVTRIQCHVTNGTSKVIAIEDASGNSSEDITCGTANTTDDGSITNATYTASELSRIDFGATTGAVDYVSISAFGELTRE